MKKLGKLNLYDLTQSEMAKRKQNVIMKTISMKIIIFLFGILIFFISCSFNVEKNDCKDNADNTIRKINYSSLSVESKQMKNISDNNVHKSEGKTSDTIYAQNDVVEAIPSLDDRGLIELIKNNFRYPNIEPINGKILVDLVIEKDGSISDVIIVKGLHPELDKEAKRVLKLMPKFTPGKKEGHPVRSKYRTFVFSVAKE